MAALMSSDLIEARFFEDEHRRVRAGLAQLQDTVGDLHRLTRDEAVERITRVLIWLRRDLLPHAAWEEAWLYARLDRQTGSPWTTRALRFEHQQVRELAGLLEAQFDEVHEHWSNRVAFNLVAALARLEALITAHIAEEERFVIPLLDEPSEHKTN